MNVFEFTDYKAYLNNYISSLPKKGRGQAGKLAEHVGISAVIVSQVLKGNRHFSEEQMLEVSGYFGFSSLETDYLMLLVRHQRAGTHSLKQRIMKEVLAMQERSKYITSRLPQKKPLDEGAKAQFYSYWYYSGIRLLTAIEKFHDTKTIADRLNIPAANVQIVVEFLLGQGLIEQGNGKLQWTEQSTHVAKDSPLVMRHHQNWRAKSARQMENQNSQDLFFTGPMVLSKKTSDNVRKKILKLIEEASHLAKDSDCEQVQCLNIDWFQF